MPIISRIGARSFKVRAIYAAIFLVLTVGALTMVYPFTLMISGSFNSVADEIYITPYPRFWFEDNILFDKYVESKYNTDLAGTEMAWAKKIGSWRTIELPTGESPKYLADYMDWRSQCPWWELGQVYCDKLYEKNARDWREKMVQQFGGNIEGFRKAFGIPAKVWESVRPPPPSNSRLGLSDPYRDAFRKWAETRPVADRIMTNLDGQFLRGILQTHYTANIKEYNRSHGTSIASYEDVFLDARVPATAAADQDWQAFLQDIGYKPDSADSDDDQTGRLPRLEHVKPTSLGLVKDSASAERHHFDAQFLEQLKKKYDNDITKLNKKYKTEFDNFDQVRLGSAREDWEAFLVDRFRDFLLTRYSHDLTEPSGTLDPDFVEFLKKKYPGEKLAKKLNLPQSQPASLEAVAYSPALKADWKEFSAVAKISKAYACKTPYRTIKDVPIMAIVREDWQEMVRENLRVRHIHLDESLTPSFRKFLHDTYQTVAASASAASAPSASASSRPTMTAIEAMNKEYGTSYASFDVVPMPTEAPVLTQGTKTKGSKAAQNDWDIFLKSHTYCLADNISVEGPRQLFEQYLAKKYNKTLDEIGHARLPIYHADAADCMANTSALRWEFSTRNYKHVLEYLLFHGRGFLNTMIYVVLAISTHLLVNPLAAYALSRYKLRSTYKILLFCMATMAFPGEVTMIPNFLLMRRFPLWSLLGGAAAFILGIWLLSKILPKVNEMLRLTLALGLGILVGVWFVPTVMGMGSVSLLNTFAALVLPGMGAGFSVFLLKGFFDSLPAELYEAASLDGASEFRKFWTITMSLSKPILAVIALGAFNAAYSNFMMALVIIPDQSMWTLMVWVFQLRSVSHQAVMYASLVLTAIPTLLVFVVCQNLIIRGIVVPTEK